MKSMGSSLVWGSYCTWTFSMSLTHRTLLVRAFELWKEDTINIQLHYYTVMHKMAWKFKYKEIVMCLMAVCFRKMVQSLKYAHIVMWKWGSNKFLCATICNDRLHFSRKYYTYFFNFSISIVHSSCICVRRGFSFNKQRFDWLIEKTNIKLLPHYN